MKKLKVFHGLSEVAGQAYYSVLGLRLAGIETQYVVWQPNCFGYKYDISLNIDRTKKYLFPLWAVKLLIYECKILRQNDVFHFHFGRSLLINHDLFIFHKLKKKVFFEFHGSDIRDNRYAHEINKYVLVTETEEIQKKLKKRARKICRYADGIILHDDELIAHLPENHPPVYVVPLRMDLQKIEPVYVSTEKKKIRIVHATTNREAKGSKFVIEAIKELEHKYDIELVCVENKSQQEALELYKTADVIVDQLRTGTYGVFAIESMAMGKPVITYITDEMRERLPEDLPICSANPDTIRDVLETLIRDGDLRYDLGIRGREYAEKYHDYRKNAQMLYDIYSGEIGPMQGREAFQYAAERK